MVKLGQPVTPLMAGDWFGCEKARESVSVAILPIEASRIALSKSDGNAEAHASICNRCASGCGSREPLRRMHGVTYPRASTVAQPLT